MVITTEELAALTDEQRAVLARVLRETSGRRPALMPSRPRLVFAIVSAICAIVLVSWIFILGMTLPADPPAGAWRATWIGFDALEAAAFAMTAWAAWHRRQVTILAAIVTGTLLICDAWFDVTLSWGSAQQWPALATAVLIEVPLGLLLFRVSNRMAHLSVSVVRTSLGLGGPAPSAHRLLLFDPLFDEPGSVPAHQP